MKDYLKESLIISGVTIGSFITLKYLLKTSLSAVIMAILAR